MKKASDRDVFRKIFFLLTMGFILHFAATGQTKQVVRIDSLPEGRLINLNTWLYHPGDLPEYADPGFLDDDWDTLSTRLDLTGKDDAFFPGKAWFRLHLEFDSSLLNNNVALLINQLGASQIYHNGRLIHEMGTIGAKDKKEITRSAKDVPIILHTGNSTRHLLAVRYSNVAAFKMKRTYNSALAGFAARITTYHSALRLLTDQVVSSNITLVLTLIFVVLGALHLLLFVFFREKKANLYYSLFVFGFSVLIFWTYCINSFLVSPAFSMRLVYFISLFFPWVMIPLVKMLYILFLEKNPVTYYILLALSAIIPIWYFFNGPFVTVAFVLYTVFVFAEVVRVVVLSLIRKKPGIRIIGTGVSFFIIFFLFIAMIILLQGNLTVSGASVWGFLLLLSIVFSILSIPVSMSVYLARDFGLTNKNLKTQLENVKMLSAKTLEQEKEKQRMLEGQKERLEVMVAERTRELASEKEKTEQLLLNTLPVKVVNDLKMNGKTDPESFDEVTVYFSDIVGFTNISTTLEPAVLIGELNEIFTAFDNIMESHRCERIKTIGDAYLAVCGMPERRENHAENMARAALEIRQFLEERNRQNAIQWKIRIGLHSGKVVGGIVGVKKYIYDVFGDTINTTSRMESNSEPMRINVSETTWHLIKHTFEFIPRQPMEIKGKGMMRMYFLEGVKPDASPAARPGF